MYNNNILKFNERLAERKYSEKTIKTYIKCIESFYIYTNNREPDQTTFTLYCTFLNNQNLSYSYIKISSVAVNALSSSSFLK